MCVFVAQMCIAIIMFNYVSSSLVVVVVVVHVAVTVNRLILCYLQWLN